jgi:hypothetical protein
MIHIGDAPGEVAVGLLDPHVVIVGLAGFEFLVVVGVAQRYFTCLRLGREHVPIVADDVQPRDGCGAQGPRA